MDVDWVKRFEELSSRLFDQVNGRSKEIESRVSTLKSKIKELGSTIDRITSDPNKPIKLMSPPNYPMTESMEIRQTPIEFKRMQNVNIVELVSKPISQQLTFEDCDGIEQATRRQLERVGELVKPLKVHGTKRIISSFENIRSISSLLVFHSYESRFMPSDRAAHARQYHKSMTSESSHLEHGARSLYHRQKTLTLADRNKSSSGEEMNQGHDLGPVPDSILRYHQESFLEPDTLDAFDLINYDDGDEDAGNLITGDLPDILPSLSGIVRDVNRTPEFKSSYNRCESPMGRNRNDFDEKTPTVEPRSQTTGPPPPPPPPIPSTPLHGLPLLHGAKPVQSQATNSDSLPLQPPLPPPLPPMLGQLGPSSQENLETRATANTSAPSGRDALLAEIRAAASKPKARPVRQEAVSEDIETSATKVQRPVPSASDNPRDSLLASIRQAAGKPSGRKATPTAKSRHIEEKLERSKQTSTVGGADLMSDLVNKLRARRDGISGAAVPKSPESKIENEQKKTTPILAESVGASVTNPQIRALSQISSMIPARPPSSNGDDDSDNDSGSNGFNDDDWS